MKKRTFRLTDTLAEMIVKEIGLKTAEKRIARYTTDSAQLFKWRQKLRKANERVD